MQLRFLYVLIYSGASVFIEKIYFSISPFFSLMITASIATIFFNLINIGKLKKIYVACWREKKLLLAIMLVIFLNWLCSMVAPGLIGASFYNFIYFSSLGMLGFLSLGIINWKKGKLNIYLSLAVLVLIIIAVWDYLSNSVTNLTIIGILLGIFGGITAFLYYKQSQLLAKRISLSATQILAVRFYLTILILFAFLPKETFVTYLNFHNLVQLTLLSCISLIAPLYFAQKALEKITSEQNAIIFSMVPVVTAVLQQIVFQNVMIKMIAFYFIYTLIVAISYIANKYKTARLVI